MDLRVRHYILPKEGNTDDECEDACAFSQEEGAAVWRFAVADGATTSVFSCYWARLLVNSYCSGQMQNGNLEESLLELRELWWEHASDRAQKWYVKEKIQRGAHATLLGLSIFASVHAADDVSPGAGTFSAIAIGDACLFHVRKDQLLSAFPIASAGDFSTSPSLLSSLDPLGNLSEDLRQTKGEWFPGDVFLLMTDAMSCWLLSEQHERLPLIEPNSRDRRAFQYLIDYFRSGRDWSNMPFLKNDDVTLMRIEMI